MNKTYEDEIQRAYWSISEVAELLHEAPSAIRFWLGHFNLDVKKNRKGNRQFTPEDVEQVKRMVVSQFELFCNSV